MFKIGADPEAFIHNGEAFVAAEDNNGPLIPGTKEKPHKVTRGAVQVDGLAVEFNITPAKDEDEFFKNICAVSVKLNQMIKKHDPKFKLAAVSYAEFDPKYFRELPDHSKILGCEPDFSSKTLKANPAPDPQGGAFRTAGGHLHFSWGNGFDVNARSHLLDCQMVVEEMERYVGPILRKWDGSDKRAKLYGAEGAFRPKKYGVEWRSPSNCWLKTEERVRQTWRLCYSVLNSLERGTHNFNFKHTAKTAKAMIEHVEARI